MSPDANPRKRQQTETPCKQQQAEIPYKRQQAEAPCKRQQAETPCESATNMEDALPSKRLKLSSQNQPRRPQTLPHFWDTLGEIRLSRTALKEFDHRVLKKELQSAIPPPPSNSFTVNPSPTALKSFARCGGPDLSDLRGFSTSGMRSRSQPGLKMSSTSGGTKFTPRTNPSDSQYAGKIHRAGIYEQGHLYPDNEPDPPENMDEIQARLVSERSSLSPSRFTEQDFLDFQRQVNRSKDSEALVMAHVIPPIEGRHAKHYKMSGAHFNHIEQFRKDIAYAVPDAYDGAIPETIDERVLRDLAEKIIPCNNTNRPTAPNVFTEAKKTGGNVITAKLQACHDGAIGARAMHSLQNYGRENPTYDGKAYAFSTTYHGDNLKLYATHPTAPKAPGQNPEYHMMQLGSYAMTHNSKAFREGAAAYRNLRDLGAEIRNTFIEQANATARDIPVSARYETGSARHETGSDRYETDSARHETGSARYKTGSARHEPGSARHEPGSARHETGSARHETGSVRYNPSSVRYKTGSNRSRLHLFAIPSVVLTGILSNWLLGAIIVLLLTSVFVWLWPSFA